MADKKLGIEFDVVTKGADEIRKITADLRRLGDAEREFVTHLHKANEAVNVASATTAEIKQKYIELRESGLEPTSNTLKKLSNEIELVQQVERDMIAATREVMGEMAKMDRVTSEGSSAIREYTSSLEKSERSLEGYTQEQLDANKATVAARGVVLGLSSGVAKLTKSTSDLALEQSIAKASARDLTRWTRDLALEVRSGKKSFDDAAAEVEYYTKELGLSEKETKDQIRSISDMKREMDLAADSVGKLALEKQVSGSATRELTKKTKELATAVRAGEKSFDDAAREADEYAKKLGISDRETKNQIRSISDMRREMDSTADSVGKLALEKQVSGSASRELTKRTKELATAVRAGEKSFDDAAREADEYAKKLGVAEKETRSYKQSASEMNAKVLAASAVFAGFAVAAERAYEFIGDGAELAFAADQFDRLAVSIGTTGDVLRSDLTVATGGMVSQSKLMADAAGLVSQKLAISHESVVELATISGKLNWNMDVLGLTINNLSDKRLDTLGLAVSDVIPRFRELRDSGIQANEAFTMALIEAGAKKIEIAGDASDSAVGDLRRFEAAARNAADGVKRTAVESTIAEAAIKNLTTILIGFDALQSAKLTAQEDLTKAVQYGIITQEGANVILQQAIRGDELYIRRLADVRAGVDALEESTADISTSSEEYVVIAAELEARQLAYAESVANVGIEQLRGIKTSDNYVDSLYDTADAEEATAKAAEASAQAIEDRAAATEAMIAANEAMFAGYKAADGALQPLEDAYRDLGDAQGEWVEYAIDNSALVADISAELAADLTDDQEEAYKEILNTVDKGSAEWLAAYEGLQSDLTASQRNALISQNADLQGVHGEIAQAFTGDAKAAEEAQERIVAAQESIQESLEQTALVAFEAALQQQEGGVLLLEQYLELEVALGNMTEAEAESRIELYLLTEQMGFLGTSFADTTLTAEQQAVALELLRDGHVKTKEEAERLAGTYRNVLSASLHAAAIEAERVGAALVAASGHYAATFDVTYNTYREEHGGADGGGYQHPDEAPKYADGADFTVPSQYINDTFPMWVSAGERVQVTPAAEVGSTTSTELPPIIMNFYGQTEPAEVYDAASDALEMARAMGRA